MKSSRAVGIPAVSFRIQRCVDLVEKEEEFVEKTASTLNILCIDARTNPTCHTKPARGKRYCKSHSLVWVISITRDMRAHAQHVIFFKYRSKKRQALLETVYKRITVLEIDNYNKMRLMLGGGKGGEVKALPDLSDNESEIHSEESAPTREEEERKEVGLEKKRIRNERILKRTKEFMEKYWNDDAQERAADHLDRQLRKVRRVRKDMQALMQKLVDLQTNTQKVDEEGSEV